MQPVSIQNVYTNYTYCRVFAGILFELSLQRELSITHTGAINFGDVIMLLNVGSKVMDEERPPTALSLDFDQDVKIKEGCGVVSSAITKPTYRTAFTVTRFDMDNPV